MRAVVQRVLHAAVEVDGEEIARIGKGFLVLLGVEKEDTEEDQRYICDKLLHLRVFEDENGKMNLDIQQSSGQLLLVSQFTLLGDCRKGRRPSFAFAMEPERAESFFEACVKQLRDRGLTVYTGRFGADMKVSLTNDGPVTVLLDSRRTF